MSIILAFALAAAAFAAPLAARAVGPDRVVQIVAAPLPPFRFQNDAGAIIGVDIDIMRAVLARAGYEADIEMRPFLRAADDLRRGRANALASSTLDADLGSHVSYSAPISAARDVFFKRADDALVWLEFDDLNHLRLGASRGYNYSGAFWRFDWSRLDTVVSGAEYGPEALLLRQLAADRIDVAICEVSVCTHIAANEPGLSGEIDYIDRTVGEVRTFHIVFSDDRVSGFSNTLKREFDAALAEYKAEGAHRAVYERYHVDILRYIY